MAVACVSQVCCLDWNQIH